MNSSTTVYESQDRMSTKELVDIRSRGSKSMNDACALSGVRFLRVRFSIRKFEYDA